MANDFLTGTWKGEMILSAEDSYLGKEEISSFYLRIKHYSESGTFSGIYMANPEHSKVDEHAKIAGEVSVDMKFTFDVRYSKFYYQDEDSFKIKRITDGILTFIKFKSTFFKDKTLLGIWETDANFFEHEGVVIKTYSQKGNWWAKKIS